MVAHARDVSSGEVRKARLTPDYRSIIDWLLALVGPVEVGYEAGPTGFGLYRAIVAAGMACTVAAPSKLQRPVGDRVKTDAKDAAHIEKLLRMGELVAVTVPDENTEAARDLVRARDDARGDLMRARHRLSKLLLRQGIVYYDGKAWTGKHEQWLRRQHFDNPALQAAFDNDFDAVLTVSARRDSLDERIIEMAADSTWTPVATRLQCLRGISVLTAFGLAVEIGDWSRFTGASIGAYTGLVPSEYSSGQSRSQGPITKAGNTHVRRLLVEAAWHHRRAYRCPSAVLRARWEAAGPGRQGTAAMPVTSACTSGGPLSMTGARTPASRISPSLASLPAGAGPWPCSTKLSALTILGHPVADLMVSRERTHELAMCNNHFHRLWLRRTSLDQSVSVPVPNTVQRYPTRAYQSDTTLASNDHHLTATGRPSPFIPALEYHTGRKPDMGLDKSCLHIRLWCACKPVLACKGVCDR
ncbi:putative transposase (plasmid) [Gordonia polyisoprenivorans VH2]|uniref:Putative transposase n=1 Tax=Gordonia polyisoprenivorans (strain DSM 44266 / VH2) TaxID=1112204 RepID=H6N5D7_GORPV|nr:putative transposase [Gordonia polyisoprenivorans VH2]